MMAVHQEPGAVGLDHGDRSGSRDGLPTDILGQIGKVYSRSGGVLSGQEVSLLMRRHCDQPVSQLARWIVNSNIISFDHQGQTWIPLFQFDQEQMTIKPAVSALLAELAPRINGNELAVWFVSPNECLSGATPLEAIEVDFAAVLKAASADRFAMRG